MPSHDNDHQTFEIVMTSPLGTFGQVVSLLTAAATLYQGTHDKTQKLSNILSIQLLVKVPRAQSYIVHQRVPRWWMLAADLFGVLITKLL